MITDQRVHDQWMLTPYVEGAEVNDKFKLAYQRGARAAIAEEIDEFEALPGGVGLSRRGRPRHAEGVQRAVRERHAVARPRA